MKQVVALSLILLFVWATILVGGWLIWTLIVPIELPNRALTGIIKTGLGTGLVVFWLWMWRKFAYEYFWRTIKRLKPE